MLMRMRVTFLHLSVMPCVQFVTETIFYLYVVSHVCTWPVTSHKRLHSNTVHKSPGGCSGRRGQEFVNGIKYSSSTCFYIMRTYKDHQQEHVLQWIWHSAAALTRSTSGCGLVWGNNGKRTPNPLLWGVDGQKGPREYVWIGSAVQFRTSALKAWDAQCVFIYLCTFVSGQCAVL